MMSEQFKQVLGCFATGVTVVTSMYEDKPCGVTVNSFSSVSLDPPLVLFNLAKTASSYPLISGSPVFTINILAEDQIHLSQHFAFTKTHIWKDIAYDAGKNHCPVLKGAIAVIECDAYRQYEGGDHTIFVGKVTHLQKNSDKKPLLYFRGKYSNVNDIV